MPSRSMTPGRAACCWLEAYLLPMSVTLLAMAVQLHGLESKSLWYDELGTLTVSAWRGSWLDAVRNPLTMLTTPKTPLPFLLTHAFLTLGDRVFFLRLPSAVFATLTVPAVYVLGKLFFDRQTGLIGAFLLAIAPLQIRYAQEARMYALWTFLLVLSLYFFWRAVSSRAARWWAAFVLVAALALYTHLFTVLPLGVMVLFALWLLVRRPGGDRFPFVGWHLVVALVCLLIVYAPLLPFLMQGLTSDEGLGAEPTADWDAAALVDAIRLFSGGHPLGLVVYACLLAVGVWALAVRDRALLVLVAGWIVLPVAVVLLTPFSHAVRIRYFLFSLPVYLLLVAYGLRVLSQRSRAWVERLTRPALPDSWAAHRWLVPGLLLALMAALSVPATAAYYAESKQNWRDATWLVGQLAHPGDQILVRHPYEREGVLFYARQAPKQQAPTTEEDVHLLPRDLTEVVPPGDERTYWLIVPPKTRFLPGGELDAAVQPHHGLGSPYILYPSVVPADRLILSPLSFRTLAVVPVVPADTPTTDS